MVEEILLLSFRMESSSSSWFLKLLSRPIPEILRVDLYVSLMLSVIYCSIIDIFESYGVIRV